MVTDLTGAISVVETRSEGKPSVVYDPTCTNPTDTSADQAHEQKEYLTAR
jgi:hypothetical protein